jgi:hypothetical protein
MDSNLTRVIQLSASSDANDARHFGLPRAYKVGVPEAHAGPSGARDGLDALT